MTNAHSTSTYGRHSFSPRSCLYGCMAIFMTALFFMAADTAAIWVSDGLRLCASKLIPSLFPFMVLSSLLVSGGAGELLARLCRVPFKTLFGIGGECGCAVALGWLCGFPVGAKCAREYYEKGRVSRDEYERVLCICSTPSPAFLIGAVGRGMLGSAAEGVLLYVISLLSSAIIGIFLKRFGKSLAEPRGGKDARVRNAESFVKSLTRAVSDGAMGMLCVCAFVVFFSAFLGALKAALAFIHMSKAASALLFCVFELTSGISAVVSSGLPSFFPLLALAVGWSGLSVHFQTLAICDPSPVSFKPYFLSHVARAALCFILGTAAQLTASL